MAVVRNRDAAAVHEAGNRVIDVRRVALGEVSLGTMCRVDVPVWGYGASARAGWHEQLDGAASGFTGAVDFDVLSITFAPDGPGTHAATLVVFGDRGPVLKVELSARVPGDLGLANGGLLSQWPRTLTEREAAEALEAWAAEHRLVPDWRFGADITVRDASVVRATVLTQCEGVATAARRASALPELPVGESGDMRLEPGEWERSSCQAIVAESVAGHAGWVAYKTITRTRTLEQQAKLSGDRRLATAGSARFRGVCWWADAFAHQVPAQHQELFDWVGAWVPEQRINQVAQRISVEVLPVTAVECRDGRAARTAYLIGDGGTVSALTAEGSVVPR